MSTSLRPKGMFGKRIARHTLAGFISAVLGTPSSSLEPSGQSSFTKPVYIGDTITATVTVSELIPGTPFWGLCQPNGDVLIKGTAVMPPRHKIDLQQLNIMILRTVLTVRLLLLFAAAAMEKPPPGAGSVYILLVNRGSVALLLSELGQYKNYDCHSGENHQDDPHDDVAGGTGGRALPAVVAEIILNPQLAGRWEYPHRWCRCRRAALILGLR